VTSPGDEELRLGPKSKEWLRRVGITSRSELKAIGVDRAYATVVDAGHGENRNFYYGLAADVLDVHWTEAREILLQNPDLFAD
jgi:hypothetical protein